MQTSIGALLLEYDDLNSNYNISVRYIVVKSIYQMNFNMNYL